MIGQTSLGMSAGGYEYSMDVGSWAWLCGCPTGRPPGVNVAALVAGNSELLKQNRLLKMQLMDMRNTNKRIMRPIGKGR